MYDQMPCPNCAALTPAPELAKAFEYSFWQGPDGACPAWVQQTLLDHGDDALHEHIQTEWPLDAAAAFGALPTPLRLHADPRFAGRGGAQNFQYSLKLITRHYQHVDGTSFAAPLVASTVACMLEANDTLTPATVRQLLQQTATPIPNVPHDRQGAGALTSGTAVAMALQEQHAVLGDYLQHPHIDRHSITFLLHHHDAEQVRVMGSWNEWTGEAMREIEAGVWHLERPLLSDGRYAYKFLINDSIWLDDPANPRKVGDGFGGFNSLFMIDKP